MYTLKRLNVVKQVQSEHEANKLLAMGYTMVSKSDEAPTAQTEYSNLVQEVEQLKKELERLKSEKLEQTGGETNGESDDGESDDGKSTKTNKTETATRGRK